VRHSGNSILVCLARLVAALMLCCSSVVADSTSQPSALPADSVLAKCAGSQVWEQDAVSVAELLGPVSI